MIVSAALFFTVGGVFMKLSEGLSRFWPSLLVFLFFVIGAGLQSIAMRKSDLGVTYILVLGLEAALAFSVGVFFFKESSSMTRIGGVLLIVAGIACLRGDS